jgi:gas vesicle protein
MGDGYDRFESEGGGGGAFVMGLLTGTVLGAGLGMLFAPKSGSELRSQISDQANSIANQASDGYRRASEAAGQLADRVANQASDGYRRASEAAGDLADRSRAVYDKAREAVSRGADEAQRYIRETAASVAASTGNSGSGGSGARRS